MTTPPDAREEWIPCPPGKLATFSGRERVRQRRQFLVRAGRTVGAVALAAGAGWLVFRELETPEPTFGGIACSRVRELAPLFMMGELDPAVTQQIETHLKQCDECRSLLESMPPRMSAQFSHGGSARGCQCSTCRRDGLVELLATTHSRTLRPAMPPTFLSGLRTTHGSSLCRK